MPCCGRQVSNFAPPANVRRSASPHANGLPAPPQARQSHVYFEYAGQTGLTVTGPVSGRRYRFDGPGARVPVEPVDKPAMERIPNLRRVLGPG
jgi:hypothetical protein